METNAQRGVGVGWTESTREEMHESRYRIFLGDHTPDFGRIEWVEEGPRQGGRGTSGVGERAEHAVMTGPVLSHRLKGGGSGGEKYWVEGAVSGVVLMLKVDGGGGVRGTVGVERGRVGGEVMGRAA